MGNLYDSHTSIHMHTHICKHIQKVDCITSPWAYSQTEANNFSTQTSIPTLSCTLVPLTVDYITLLHIYALQLLDYHVATLMVYHHHSCRYVPPPLTLTGCCTHSWTPQESWSIYCWRIGSINYCNILSRKEKVHPILHSTPSHPFAIIGNNTDLVCLLFGYNQHLPHHH